MKLLAKINLISVVLCGVIFVGVLESQPPALENVGQTCYMNSLLQNLFNIVPLSEKITKMPLTKDFFANGYIKAFQAMNNAYPDNAVNETVLQEIGQQGCKRMSVQFGDQHDAHELLRAFWSDNNFKKEFLKLFGNKAITQIVCPSVGFDSLKDDPQEISKIERKPDIGIGITGKTLESCLDSWHKEELKEYKVKGKKVPGCIKKEFFVELSDYLAIHLRRFTLVGFNVGPIYQKITSSVIISEKLDLKKYTLPLDNNAQYSLIGVVVHSGSLDGGHYVAYIKDQRSKKQAWWYCSDNTIEKRSWKQVQSAIAKEAYILFYKKENAQQISSSVDIGKELHQLGSALNSLAASA